LKEPPATSGPAIRQVKAGDFDIKMGEVIEITSSRLLLKFVEIGSGRRRSEEAGPYDTRHFPELSDRHGAASIRR
jgi:hypothetical protein